MPIRLRIDLCGDTPVNALHATGLRAVVYKWLSAGNPDDAREVHDANQAKPYSIGPLSDGAGSSGVRSFHINVLADWIADAIVRGLAQTGPGIRLGRDSFRVRGAPEVEAAVTWNDLMATPPTASRWSIRVVSPAAHHAAGEWRKAVVLPTPENYFGSWINRWNVCAPVPLTADVMALVTERVVVSHCAGGTERVSLGRDRAFVGFVGDVTFEALKPQSLRPEDRSVLTALVRMAPFSGVGVDTMSGMGSVEILSIG